MRCGPVLAVLREHQSDQPTCVRSQALLYLEGINRYAARESVLCSELMFGVLRNTAQAMASGPNDPPSNETKPKTEVRPSATVLAT